MDGVSLACYQSFDVSNWPISSSTLKKAFTSKVSRHLVDGKDGGSSSLPTRKSKVTKSFFFHLVLVVKDQLPTYKPGQFVTVRCYVPGLSSYQPRQYSISDSPTPNHFRISVKREFATGPKPAGRVSNVLYESLPIGAELDVSMPFGDFVLYINATTPAVLISGGVGLTTMMSMLKTIVNQQGNARKVVFIHAARNGHVHAMKEDLSHIIAENPSVSRVVFYEEASAQDKKGVDYDHVGRVNLAEIKNDAVLPDADYYILWAAAVHEGPE